MPAELAAPARFGLDRIDQRKALDGVSYHMRCSGIGGYTGSRLEMGF